MARTIMEVGWFHSQRQVPPLPPNQRLLHLWVLRNSQRRNSERSSSVNHNCCSCSKLSSQSKHQLLENSHLLQMRWRSLSSVWRVSLLSHWLIWYLWVETGDPMPSLRLRPNRFTEGRISVSRFLEPLNDNEKVRSGKRPCARDGHRVVMLSTTKLLVFGGDRHNMSFSDVYQLDL